LGDSPATVNKYKASRIPPWAVTGESILRHSGCHEGQSGIQYNKRLRRFFDEKNPGVATIIQTFTPYLERAKNCNRQYLI